MVGRELLFRPRGGEHGARVSVDPVVADKDKYRMGEIRGLPRGLEELPEAIVRVAEGVHFLQRVESAGLQLLDRDIELREFAQVFGGDRVRTMVVGGLDDGEKRF